MPVAGGASMGTVNSWREVVAQRNHGMPGPASNRVGGLIISIASPQKARFERPAASHALLAAFINPLLPLTGYIHHAAVAVAANLFQVITMLVGKKIRVPAMSFRIDRGGGRVNQSTLHGVAFVVSPVSYIVPTRVTERFALLFAVGRRFAARCLVQKAVALAVGAAGSIPASASTVAEGIAVLTRLSGSLCLAQSAVDTVWRRFWGIRLRQESASSQAGAL